MDNKLYCGLSMRDITPAFPIALAGYAARWGKLSNGKAHDPIYIKALYVNSIEPFLLLSADVCELSNDNIIESKIKAATGINTVIIASTHTHSAPYTVRPASNPEFFDKEWYSHFIEQAVAAAKDAINNSFEAYICASQSPLPGIAKNRRDLSGITDNDLSFISIFDKNDTLRGMLVHFTCHCTVLDANNDMISADYPAYIYKNLNDKYPDSVVMFFNGAAGDINIGYSSDDSALGVKMDFRSFKKANEIGTAISKKINNMLPQSEKIKPAIFNVCKSALELPLKSDLPDKKTLINKIKKQSDIISNAHSAEERRKGKLEKIYMQSLLDSLDLAGNGKSCTLTSYQIVLGKWMLITLPLELFCKIGIDLKKKASALGYKLCIIGYAGGYYGYLPTEEAFLKGGYEAEVTPFSSSAAAVLVQSLTRQMRECK